jgi:hypothetical protein
VRADAAANALFAFGYPTSIVVIAAPSRSIRRGSWRPWSGTRSAAGVRPHDAFLKHH